MISYLQSVPQVIHTGHLCPYVRARALRGLEWMPVDHYLFGKKIELYILVENHCHFS